MVLTTKCYQTGHGTHYKGVIHDILDTDDEENTKCEDTDDDDDDDDNDDDGSDMLYFSDPMFMGPDRETQIILQRRFMIHYDDGDKKVETLSRRRWKLLPLKEDEDEEEKEEDENDPYVKLRKEYVPKLTLVRQSVQVATKMQQESRKESLIATAICVIRQGDFSPGAQVFNQQSVVSRIASFMFFPYGHSGCRVKIESIRKRKSTEDDLEIEKDPSNTTLFKVGDKIRARWRGQPTWYSGVILNVNSSDKTYDINYDDGDKETNVAETLIQRSDQTSDPSLLKDAQGTYVSFRVRAMNDAGYGYPSKLSYIYDPSKLLDAAATETDDDDDDDEKVSHKEDDEEVSTKEEDD